MECIVMRKKKKRNNKAKIYYVYDLKNHEECIGCYKDYEAVEDRLNVTYTQVIKNLERKNFVKGRYHVCEYTITSEEYKKIFNTLPPQKRKAGILKGVNYEEN